MQIRNTHSCVKRSFFLVGSLLAAALAQAQNLNVTAANASNPAIYTVNFATRTINIENTDTVGLHSRSLAFTPNGTNDQVDLLVADNVDGLLLRYCGNFNPNASPPANTAGVVVWNKTEGGPTNPDGLSASGGDLYLVNQGSGTSTSPQVWLIQGLETNCQANPARTPTVTLIDSKFSPKQTLEETLIVKSPIFLTGQNAAVTQLNPGDLLVLTSNPASVILYQGSNGLGPMGKTPPIILLNGNNFPAGTQPGGLDFLPTDNSLLITSSTGTIFKFTVDQIVPTTGLPTQTPFAQNLGNGQFKVRTGQQSGNVFAFVANNNGGDIFEFDASGTLLSTVTSGVQHPQGLAVTNIAYQKFADCFGNPQIPCDVLGDNGAGQPLLNHVVTAPAVTGNILENMCVVVTDPRIARCGSCTNAANANCPSLANPAQYQNGLKVAEACGAIFDNPNNHLVIPNSMCGASGTNSSGFTLVKTLTSAYSGATFPFNGTYIETDSDFTGLPPNLPNDPVCATAPFQVAGWAPLAGEGVNPGGSSVLDLTNGCASPHTGGGILSLWVLGTRLVPEVTGGLVGYATTEYTTLLNTVTAETVAHALTPPGGGNFTSQLQQCIQESKAAFLKSSAFYLGAAQELLIADYKVASNAVAEPSPPFHGPFAPNGNYPNPSGVLRALIETTRFTVDVRLAGDPNTDQPANPPPLPSFTNPDIRPTIGGAPPSPTGSNGQQYTYNPVTADFANNTQTLTYSLTGLPWATLSTLNNNQVQVSGKARKQGSPFNAVLTVTDGCGVITQLPWTVTVN